MRWLRQNPTPEPEGHYKISLQLVFFQGSTFKSSKITNNLLVTYKVLLAPFQNIFYSCQVMFPPVDVLPKSHRVKLLAEFLREVTGQLNQPYQQFHSLMVLLLMAAILYQQKDVWIFQKMKLKKVYPIHTNIHIYMFNIFIYTYIYIERERFVMYVYFKNLLKWSMCVCGMLKSSFRRQNLRSGSPSSQLLQNS